MSRIKFVGRGITGHPGADALVVESGRIAAIGHRRDLVATKTIELEGDLGAPRHDHHFHPFGYAGSVLGLSLKQAGSFAGLSRQVRVELARLNRGEALIGNRLDEESLAEHRLPTRLDLDDITGNVPTLIYRYCGHLAVANSAALVLAGLGNHQDGILRETEIAPVAEALTPLRPPLAPSEVKEVLAGLASLGLGKITAIVSATDPLWCEVDDELATLLEIAPGLPLDIEVLVIAPTPADLREAAAMIRQAKIDNVSFLGWKEFADGALGARTAALHEPFSDDQSNRGILRLDEAHAYEMAMACKDLGATIAIHAIGDRANHAVLSFFATLLEGGVAGSSLRIEHASMLDSTARQRMAELSITASVQPAFITSEVEWLSTRVGERIKDTYALSAMEQAGIRLLGGSDCPVESPNPWPAMKAATTAGLSADSAYGLYGRPLAVGDPAHLIETNDLDGDKTVDSVYRRGEPIDMVPARDFG